jgi:phosphatidate phosphatase PAH1
LTPVELEVERKGKDESKNQSEETVEYAKTITLDLGAVKQTATTEKERERKQQGRDSSVGTVARLTRCDLGFNSW